MVHSSGLGFAALTHPHPPQQGTTIKTLQQVAPNAQEAKDRRTAERVWEALAAGADYKYDGVRVTACNGVVQLSGCVNTSAERNRAGEVTSNVAGVKSVANGLTVKD